MFQRPALRCHQAGILPKVEPGVEKRVRIEAGPPIAAHIVQQGFRTQLHALDFRLPEIIFGIEQVMARNIFLAPKHIHQRRTFRVSAQASLIKLPVVICGIEQRMRCSRPGFRPLTIGFEGRQAGNRDTQAAQRLLPEYRVEQRVRPIAAAAANGDVVAKSIHAGMGNVSVACAVKLRIKQHVWAEQQLSEPAPAHIVLEFGLPLGNLTVHRPVIPAIE